MGYLKYVKKTTQSKEEDVLKIRKERLMQFNKEPATVRVAKPTKIARARALGYRAKQGIIIIRQRVIRGGHKRPRIKAGRRPIHNRQRMVLAKNYQQIAEEKVARTYKNCEMLNSYYITKNGRHIWYEVIIIDKHHPSIKKDKTLNWITKPQHRGRSFRGISSAGRRSRGIHTHKGIGAEKMRPSLRANGRKVN